MANETVSFDYSLYQANCSFSDVEEAIKNITASNEKQFDSIKKEKWYHRLFNCVTFSQKGKKRMAEQISSLAQAQQVLMDILVRLSAQDAQIALYINQNIQDIRRLSENDLYLQERLNQLEIAITMGIKKIDSIKDLDDNSKQVLCACLQYLCSLFNYPSQEQQEFANNVITYLGVDAETNDLEAALEVISESNRRIMAQCCLEYIFLYELNFAYGDKVSDFIDNFDLGNKTLKTIKSRIESTFDLRGEEGIINKYNSRMYMVIPEEFKLITTESELNKEKVFNQIVSQYLTNYSMTFLAETDDYYLLYSDVYSMINPPHQTPFVSVNKESGEIAFPFDNDDYVNSHKENIRFAKIMACSGQLFVTCGNTVCMHDESESIGALLDLDNEEITEFELEGECIAFIGESIIFVRNVGCGHMELFSFNPLTGVTNKITENISLRNDNLCSNYCYDDSKLYFIAENQIKKYSFGDQEIQSVIPIENAQNIFGLYVDESKEAVYLIIAKDIASSLFQIVRLHLQENKSSDILYDELYIHRHSIFNRQSTPTNCSWYIIAEKSVETANSSPEFILKRFVFGCDELQTVSRDIGYAEYSIRRDYKNEKADNELSQSVLDTLASIQEFKDNIYTASGKTPPDHTFYIHPNNIMVVMKDIVFLKIGQKIGGHEFNAYYDVKADRITSFETEE